MITRTEAILVLLIVAGNWSCAGRIPLLGGMDNVEVEFRQRQAMQYFLQAKVFETKKDFHGAIVALRNAADLDPTATIYAQLARNYEKIQDDRMALVFARKSVNIDSRQVDLRHLALRVYRRSGQKTEAAKEIEELLEIEPVNWRFYFRLVHLYIETDQEKKIGPLFDRALKRSDTPPEVRVNIAYILSRIGNYKKAESVFREVVQTHPQVENAWLGLAEVQIVQGRKEEGVQYYRNAARALPESRVAFRELVKYIEGKSALDQIMREEGPRFLYRLGIALSDSGRFMEAVRVFEFIVEMAPRTVGGWLDVARFYIYKDDYDRLDTLMDRAARAMPDSSEIYLFWGTALERENRFEEAIGVYRRGIERVPHETQLHLFWGLALEQQRRWSEALSVYAAALDLHPDYADLHLRWGIVLTKQDLWAEALSKYERSAQLDPLSVDIFLHWGLALQRLKRWEAAVDRFQKAAQLEADDTRGLFYLGSCYEVASRETGRSDYFEAAVEAFERLLRLNPQDAYALNYLGYMFADSGLRLHEAVELLTKAVSLEPNNSAFLDSLGWAYFRLGDVERANEFIVQALTEMANKHEPEASASDQAIIFNHAGDIANAMGNTSLAADRWMRALELAPENQDLKNKLYVLPVP